jgi:hypothetical protein
MNDDTPIPHCSVGHFGLFFNATCRNVWVNLDGWWTDKEGNKIGDWPILGFEVPTHFWDPPDEQVFRLQGDTIATEIVSMGLMLTDTDDPETLFMNLNAKDMKGIGNWFSVDRAVGVKLHRDSFFDLFTEVVLDTGGIQPNQLLLARTLVRWTDVAGNEKEHWFFHVHQAHSKVRPPIDIKPQSCPNPLNLKSKGVLPVAVLGTMIFDVITIDPATIGLGRDGVPIVISPLRWAYEDVATPFEGELCNCHTLGPDDYLDLTLKFSVPELAEKLKLAEVAGETIPLTLTASLKPEFGGIPIRGKDCIWVLKEKGPQKPGKGKK